MPSQSDLQQARQACKGSLRAILAAGLCVDPSDVVGVLQAPSYQQLRAINEMGKAGHIPLAQAYSTGLEAPAKESFKAFANALAYMLDPAHTPLPMPIGQWKKPKDRQQKMGAPAAWEQFLDGVPEEGGGQRDYTVPLNIFRPPGAWEGIVDPAKKAPPLPEKALASAHLVRALMAHNRKRAVRHPEGDEFNMDSLVELGAKVRDPDPWIKTIHRPSIPHVVVLIDCSGSMTGQPIQLANYAATVVALSCLRARCPFDIVPYTGDHNVAKGIHWKPGQKNPELPVRFRAGGGNDMMGATILTSQELFGKPDPRTRRIVITMADSDIMSTSYHPDRWRAENYRRVRRPTPDLLVKLGLGRYSPSEVSMMHHAGGLPPLYYAWHDTRWMLDQLGAEAHAMFVGEGVDAAHLSSGVARMYVDRYRSAVYCKDFNEFPGQLARLATSILQTERQGA